MAKSHTIDEELLKKYHNEVAIIGIGCRFPGADNYHQFWVNMKNGVDSIQEIGDRWDVDKFYSTDLKKPNTTNSKWCGKIDNIDIFDNSFFNISPREAKNMDPQQRLLLEESWHCIEDSSIPLSHLREKKTSVYVGVMASDYHQEASSENVIIDSYAGLGNYNCILANRISYFFGFSGVSMAVDAACASSLVAIHQGRHSLLNMESDYVIAGGVAVNTHPWKYISFSKSRMFSPDGRCKTFDKDANGYVPGEGIAVILMQRVSEALRDGNHIYGVIKGSAVNHGGATRSITAPRVGAQKDLILTSFREAAFSPETITYTEAHGTGTSLGDPIEVEALTRVFKEFVPYEVEYDDYEKNILAKLRSEADQTFVKSIYKEDKRKSRHILFDDSIETRERLRKLLLKIKYLTGENEICKIGSVKTNIGHLEAAAGVAGVIKVLMMMKYRKIPPLVHLKTPNPIINWQFTPFQLAKELSDWKPARRGLPLRAGVSSFGFGGVNSHILLEEFPQQYKGNEKDKDFFNLFLLSAKSKSSFLKLAEKWQGYLDSRNFKKFTLKDICMNLSKGRSDFAYRAGLKVKKKEDLREQLACIGDIMHKQQDTSWCLRLGEFSWTGYSSIKSLIDNHKFFSLLLNEVDALLKECGYEGDMISAFKKSRWDKEQVNLFTFITGYIYIESLYRLGFKPAVITAERSSVLLGLVTSGIVSLKMALEVLIGKKSFKDVLFIRPRIPFFDYLSKKTAMPFHFDEEYLKLLVTEVAEKNRLLGQILVDSVYDEEVEKNVETRLGALLLRNKIISEEQLHKALELQSSSGKKIGDILIEQKFCGEDTLSECLKQQSILHYYLDEVIYRDKALLLSDSQFTFKRYLEEWDAILEESGRQISTMMANKEIITGKESSSIKEKALLMLIIMSSLKKLNQKWNLTDQKLEEELRFYELIDLVVDNVMPKELVVELFLGEEPDYTKIKHVLNIRQKYGNVDKSYTYIRDTNKNIKEVPDTEAWYNAAVAAKPELGEKIAYIPVADLSYINFGKIAHPAEKGSIFIPDLKQSLEEAYKDTVLELWMSGTKFKWQEFYKEVEYHRLPLPLYAFSGRSFWIKQRAEAQSITNKKRYYIVKKAWQKAPLPALEQEDLKRAILVIANKENSGAVEGLKKIISTPIITLQEGQRYQKSSDYDYKISLRSDKNGKRAAADIIANTGVVEGIIDLSDIYTDSKDAPEVNYGKIAFLQELIKEGNEDILNILHLTSGLQGFRNEGNTLSGADLAGFIKALNGEYPKVRAKTVDIDFELNDTEQLSRLILGEFNSREEETELCYRTGERYVPVARELFSKPELQTDLNFLKASSNKVVVITGGTRGIGAEVARYLVEKGAGKLVLMGTAPLPPRSEWNDILKDNSAPSGTVDKIKRVITLEDKGAEVVIYGGALTDENALTSFFEDVRKKMGPISGVIHCAGILSSGNNSEFINKEISDIERVLEPKVPGLLTLHNVFKEDKLDYFILFSSVSSFIPALANRVIDYGASNSFLTYFADYQKRIGNSYYKAICWPSWKEVGMKVAESFVYHNLGLTAHSNEDGLFLLEKCLNYDDAFMMPVVVENEELFRLERLFKAREEKTVSKVANVAGSSTEVSDAKIRKYLIELIAGKLESSPEEFDVEDSFFSMGVESIMIKEITGELEKSFDGLSSTMLFEYPNIDKLVQYLKDKKVKPGSPLSTELIAEPSGDSIEDYLKKLIAEKIESSPDELDIEDSFFSMGVESIMIKEITGELEKSFDGLSSTMLFEYPNIDKLVQYLKDKKVKPGSHLSTELIAEPSGDSIEDYLKKLIAEKLESSPEELDVEDSFFSMGVESIMIKEITGELEKNFENLSSTMLFEYPNISKLSDYLQGRKVKGEALLSASVQTSSPPLSFSEKLSDDELLNLFDKLKTGEIELETLERMTEGMYE